MRPKPKVNPMDKKIKPNPRYNIVSEVVEVFVVG